MKKIFIICLIILCNQLVAQNAEVFPTNWFVGMKLNKIQLIIHRTDGKIIPDKHSVQINYAGIKLQKVTRVSNKNYLLADILILPSTKPGIANIEVVTIDKNEKFSIPFEIKERRKGNANLFAQGVTNKDLLYLILPDRFCNGDVTNDKIPGMLDQTLRRDTVFNRHGGDLKGIISKLDYLQNLGVTALWLNPVLENDMPNRTEHGYAFTNHYKIDKRLGDETIYKNLINATHKRGMKIIQDAVYNHVGIEHILFKDLIDKNWFHQWDKYTNTTYKDQALFDPYASKIDTKKMEKGWFVPSMPDWDQTNIFVQNFLIQHAVHTVEEFGIDGWRLDTYAYNNLDFMNKCNKALYDEYPKITLFGETWVHGVPNQSFFCENNLNIPYKSNLQAATDFQTYWGIKDALTKDFGWTDGVNKLYTILAQDFIYKDPTRNVIFLDNHDINRFYSEVKENDTLYKMALGWLMSCRGIPQLYYADELGTPGFTSPNDGYVRLDFEGGWTEDKNNKFTKEGRTEKQNAIFNYIQNLAQYRKKSSALTTGKFMQYVPENDGVYIYFRYDNKQTIMCVMNTSKNDYTFNSERFIERTKGFSKAILVNKSNIDEITNAETINSLFIPKKEMRIYELVK